MAVVKAYESVKMTNKATHDRVQTFTHTFKLFTLRVRTEVSEVQSHSGCPAWLKLSSKNIVYWLRVARVVR